MSSGAAGSPTADNLIRFDLVGISHRVPVDPVRDARGGDRSSAVQRPRSRRTPERIVKEVGDVLETIHTTFYWPPRADSDVRAGPTRRRRPRGRRSYQAAPAWHCSPPMAMARASRAIERRSCSGREGTKRSMIARVCLTRVATEPSTESLAASASATYESITGPRRGALGQGASSLAQHRAPRLLC